MVGILWPCSVHCRALLCCRVPNVYCPMYLGRREHAHLRARIAVIFLSAWCSDINVDCVAVVWEGCVFRMNLTQQPRSQAAVGSH